VCVRNEMGDWKAKGGEVTDLEGWATRAGCMLASKVRFLSMGPFPVFLISCIPVFSRMNTWWWWVNGPTRPGGQDKRYRRRFENAQMRSMLHAVRSSCSITACAYLHPCAAKFSHWMEMGTGQRSHGVGEHAPIMRYRPPLMLTIALRNRTVDAA
jgi:hypothetical protein